MMTGIRSRESVAAATDVLSDDLETVDCTDVTFLVEQQSSPAVKRDDLEENVDVTLVSTAEEASWERETRSTISISALEENKGHSTLDEAQSTAETPVDSTTAQLTIRMPELPLRPTVSQTMVDSSVPSTCMRQKFDVDKSYVGYCNDAEKKPEAGVTSVSSASIGGATSCISSNRGSVCTIKCPTCCRMEIRQLITNTSISPPFSGAISADFLTKVLRQNARLKQTLRDVMSQQGTTQTTNPSIRERDDVIIQLRQELNDYRHRYRTMLDQVKTRTQTLVTHESVGFHQASMSTTLPENV